MFYVFVEQWHMAAEPRFHKQSVFLWEDGMKPLIRAYNIKKTLVWSLIFELYYRIIFNLSHLMLAPLIGLLWHARIRSNLVAYLLLDLGKLVSLGKVISLNNLALKASGRGKGVFIIVQFNSSTGFSDNIGSWRGFVFILLIGTYSINFLYALHFT